ncbi:MAG: heavy metal-binding domain-containing protein, partial [Halothiobacillus sp.]
MKSTTLISFVATGLVASVAASGVTYTLMTAPVVRPAVADDMAGMAMDSGDTKKARVPQTAPVAGKAPAEPKFVTKYTCPMHPQIIEDHPGTCPICGMTLVPKLFPMGTKDTAGDGVAANSPAPAHAPVAAPIMMPAVTVAPLTLRYMNVVLAPVQWRNLTRQIHSVGLVDFDENRLAHVHPRA